MSAAHKKQRFYLNFKIITSHSTYITIIAHQPISQSMERVIAWSEAELIGDCCQLL